MPEIKMNSFDAIVEQHRASVYSTAYHMLGCHADADCITQETFLRAYKSFSGFRGDSSISTWLTKIAYNLSLNRIKTRNRQKCFSIDNEMQYDGKVPDFVAKKKSDPLERMEVIELHQEVHQAIESLPDEQKMAVVLVLLKGMKHSEAAVILECAVSTVSWRIFEARKILMEKLKGLLE